MSAIRATFLVGLALVAWPFDAFGQVARVSTSNDTIMPDAQTVYIKSANLPGNGVIVVRGERGGSLGQLAVSAGESNDLKVRLQRRPAKGQALIVMLHADYGTPGIYDRADPVVLSVDVPAAVVSTALSR